MPSSTPEGLRANLQLEIGHILFIDLVDYSKLLLNEQTRAVDTLNEIVRAARQVQLAEKADALLRLPTGDGVALIFRNSPEAPLECAIEIARLTKHYPQLQLRMGVHSGPVQRVADVANRDNIAGAGINIAQRVMDCGDAGHILLSRHVAEDLESHERWRPNLHELGSVTVKHGVSLELVNFSSAEVGNPDIPRKVQQERRANARRRRRYIYVAALAVLIIAAALVTISSPLIWRRSPPSASQTVDQKSIAVLPFENLSEDKENAFLADGIQDDLLTNLARIKDLRVISRTSVLRYRDRARDLREIGRVLGVANVLEGSVRRSGNRVVLNVQLIDARNDHHIWANRYDRTLADALGLEGELAGEIADALQATLTPEEKSRVEDKPTQNADAWTLYLRAIPIEEGPDALLEDFRRAEKLYSEAVKLDPNFALAHARLSSTCAQLFHYYEPLDSWKTKARAEAEIALRLRPSLGEGHVALGRCIYWFDGDYERALAEFARAQQLLPNDSSIGSLVAAIRRRQGRWQESLDQYERIQRLDPQNPNIVRNLLFTRTAVRQWPQAAIVAARLRALTPDSTVGKIQSGYVEFMWKGETTTLKSLLAQVPPGTDPDGTITSCRWDAAMIDRDFDRAGQILAQCSLAELSYFNGGLTPKSFFTAMTAFARNDRVEAEKNFALAAPMFENAVREAPGAAERHANLGLIYAFMGRHDEAVREGRRAVELKPESTDANDGALMNGYLALIYARVGEKELAIPLIARLLRTPGAVDSADYSITINDLKFRWEWDPLRNDPRFQRLLTDNN